MMTRPTLIVFALLFASSASGQTSFPIQEHTRSGVTYASGGIGSDEAQAMREASADYPLTLELAAAGGGPRDEYISDARVRISDTAGKPVLEMRTEGPLVLVRLPAGTYDIDVDWKGVHRHRSLAVGHNHQHVLFEFPGSADAR